MDNYQKTLSKLWKFEQDFNKSFCSYKAYSIGDYTIEFEQRNLLYGPYIVLRKHGAFISSNVEISRLSRQPIFSEIIR